MSLSAPAVTGGVRVVLTARPGLWMTVGEVQILAKAPGQSSDTALSSLTVDGTAVPDFSPDVLSYTNARAGSVAAAPRDPYASVSLTQAGADRTAAITVTSEDGIKARTYTVWFIS
ncbi:hypothetical protein ACNAW0_13670 [Micromonospora sp. SL1-18]|uniref:hypothetical protein n=1 Tax=Micromonospora sp. SL1-18 TaxID=3399128 RepID=UPI003A4DC2D8